MKGDEGRAEQRSGMEWSKVRKRGGKRRREKVKRQERRGGRRGGPSGGREIKHRL